MAVVHHLLDRLAILLQTRLDRRGGADDPLHLAAALLAVLLEELQSGRHGVDDQRVDAVLFGDGEGLQDFLIGVVVPRQRIDVFQLAAVGEVGEQVAAEEDAADLHAADLAARQRALRPGRGGRPGLRDGGGCAPGGEERGAGGGEDGLFDEVAAVDGEWHGELLSAWTSVVHETSGAGRATGDSVAVIRAAASGKNRERRANAGAGFLARDV